MGELGTRGTTERVHVGNSPPKVARAALLPDGDGFQRPLRSRCSPRLTPGVRCQGRTEGQGQRGRKAAGRALGKVGGAGDGTRGPEQVPDGTCDAAPGDEGWQTASREEYH